MRYVLFAKESCDFCTKAVELLASQDQDFRVINFEEDHPQRGKGRIRVENGTNDFSSGSWRIHKFCRWLY